MSLQPGPWIKPANVRVTAQALDDVRLIGARAEANLTGQVTAAPVRATRSGPAQLTLSVLDPDRELVTDGRLLDRDEDMLLDDNIDLELGGIWWRLMGVEPADDGWTIALEDRSGAHLRRHDKPMKAVRGRVNRAAFVWRLYQQAGGGIDLFVPELLDRQRQEKTERPTVSAEPSESTGRATLRGDWPAKARPTVKHVRADDQQLSAIVDILAECARLGCSRRVMVATIMCATQESVMRPLGHGDGAGPDSRGYFQQRAPWGPEAIRKTAAGSCRMFLTGGKGGQPGWRQKHGSLKNAAGNLEQMIVAVQVSIGGYAKWEEEATRTVDLWLKGGGAGGAGEEKASGEKTKATTREVAYEFERGQDGKREDSLACITRLASEVEWRHWIFANVGVYASDDELVTAPVGLRIRRDDRAVVAGPTWKWDVRRQASDATCEVLVERLPEPGQVATIENEGPGSGRWMIDTVDCDLAAPVDDGDGRSLLRVALTLVRAQKRLAEPAPETMDVKTGTSSSRKRASASSTSGSAGAMAVYNKAVEISEKDYPYAWGGGHARAGSPTHGPASSRGGPVRLGYDCSGYVVACLAAAGWGFRPGGGTATSGTLMSWGKPGRGKHVTVWAHGDHVFIEFHGVGRWKRADTSSHTGDGASAGPGPHVRTGAPSSYAGFTPRHWSGE